MHIYHSSAQAGTFEWPDVFVEGSYHLKDQQCYLQEDKLMECMTSLTCSSSILPLEEITFPNEEEVRILEDIEMKMNLSSRDDTTFLEPTFFGIIEPFDVYAKVDTMACVSFDPSSRPPSCLPGVCFPSLPPSMEVSLDDQFAHGEINISTKWGTKNDISSTCYQSPMGFLSDTDDSLSSASNPGKELHCSALNCENLVRSKGYCKTHGGGRRCIVEECDKSSQSRGRCIRHGGGRRCIITGCTRGAQSSGRCKRHGGGVRCRIEECERSSQGSGLCRTHGGGKMCKFQGCTKGTQRKGFCSTHGGARVCRVENCKQVDRGGGLCGRHRIKPQ